MILHLKCEECSHPDETKSGENQFSLNRTSRCYKGIWRLTCVRNAFFFYILFPFDYFVEALPVVLRCGCGAVPLVGQFQPSRLAKMKQIDI